MHVYVKMPTIVGILTFTGMINVMLSWVEHKKVLLPRGLGLLYILVVLSSWTLISLMNLLRLLYRLACGWYVHVLLSYPLTVLPVKSDSDDMFYLQSNQGLIIDRSRVLIISTG